MLDLILIRHGETDSNTKGACVGWTDVELNEEGIKQAYQLKKKIGGIKIDGIFSSPLMRARKTAEILNEDFVIEIEYTDYLKEQNFGIWDNLTFNDIKTRYPKESCKWVKGWVNYHIKEGESVLESYKRNIKFIKEIIAKKKAGTYMAIAHLGTIRNILAYLIGVEIKNSWRFKIDNCSITIVEIKDGYGVIKLFNYGFGR